MSDNSLKEKTAKGLIWGGISNSVYQMLSLVFGLFFARLLTPSDYGVVGMLAIFSALGLILSDTGFGTALINQKEIRHEDYNAVFWFNLGLSLFCYLILFFCAPLFASFFHTPELKEVARWQFLGFVFVSFGIAPSALLSKKLMIREKAIVNIIATLISGSIGLFLAFKGFSYWSLIVQSLVWSFLISALFFFFSGWHPSLSWDFRPIKQMYGFGFKLMLTKVMEAVNAHFFSVILGRLYTKNEVGCYSQANKWNDMGSSVIRGMVNSVAHPVLVEVGDSCEREHRVFRKMVRFTVFVSFPAMFGLSFIAPEFITVALTDKWIESAQILRILCLAGAFVPLNNLFVSLILSKGDSSSFMWSTMALILVLFLAMLLVHSYGIKTMIIVYTAINILWTGVWFLIVHRRIMYSFRQFLSDILPYLGITLSLIGMAWFVTKGISNIYIRLITKILTVAISYYLVMWLSRAATFRESMRFLIGKIPWLKCIERML